MDLDTLHIQIFVSLVLVLGALFVALVCDFLKSNNEALREHTIELMVRQEERGSQQVQAAAPKAAASQAVTRDVPERVGRTLVQENGKTVLKKLGATLPASPAAELPPPVPYTTDTTKTTEASETRLKRSPLLTPASSPIPVSSKVTPIDLLERNRAVAGATRPPFIEQMIALGESLSVSEAPEPRTFAILEAPLEAEEASEPPSELLDKDSGAIAQEAAAVEAHAEITGESALAVLESEQPELAETEPQPFPAEPTPSEPVLFAAMDSAPAVEEAENLLHDPFESADGSFQVIPESEMLLLPSGLQRAAALEHSLGNKKPFCGTVIAIGFSRGKIRQAGGRSQDPQEATRAVEKLLGSLLGERDTAFQSGEDEYLLALPDELGAKAQRRLQFVSESLWDYQIRSVGVSSILFYWGCSEGQRELFAAIVNAAKERMYQTKRTRERPSSEIHHYRMNAVRS